MKKGPIVVGFFFVIICGLMIAFSPDSLTRLFVIIQTIFMLVGYVFGIFLVSRYSYAFEVGRATIRVVKEEIKTDSLWTAIARSSELFRNESLDRDFEVYKKLVAARKKNPNGTLPDIEDTFNEDAISIKIWRGAVNQIPETLTGVGILGTFVGLIIGVGGIGFSSVAAAITSLQTLINGIEVAFYTSIAGIILSICFSMVYKFYWNVLLRDMYLFIDEFHKEVINSEEEQMRELETKFYLTMLKHYGNDDAVKEVVQEVKK